jgi:hypothetical protein
VAKNTALRSPARAHLGLGEQAADGVDFERDTQLLVLVPHRAVVRELAGPALQVIITMQSRTGVNSRS